MQCTRITYQCHSTVAMSQCMSASCIYTVVTVGGVSAVMPVNVNYISISTFVCDLFKISQRIELCENALNKNLLLLLLSMTCSLLLIIKVSDLNNYVMCCLLVTLGVPPSL